MGTGSLNLNRTAVRLEADPQRVITRRFVPGGDHRIDVIVDRVLSLSDGDASELLADLEKDYSSRHRDIRKVFETHYSDLEPCLNGRTPLSEERRRLIGAYFTMEYSLESVALFNPSMVLHPDQTDLSPGSARFVMSLRACGEGHISSIEFRTGVVDARCEITMDPVNRFAAAQQPVANKQYDKARFFRKLIEMGSYNPLANTILDKLENQFTIGELQDAIRAGQPEAGYGGTYRELARDMMWLVHSNYHLAFPAESNLSERVIFPVTENESRGIEDARFVRFTDVDGSVMYYATYTAYNGFRTLPQFLATTDFRQFKIYTLNGRRVQNKGMALFPRKIGDWYYMISRLDGENIYLLQSDSVHFWNESRKVRAPVQPWEFVQIGNCGSPIETEAGWLLLTHGVGPMRQYWLGALLLDLEDPARVIGHLSEPMLVPTEAERDGYVPNVLYSCGAIVHQNQLVMPYAIADTSTSIATVPLDDLLSALRRQ